jgi:hypothetical protein
MVGLNAAGLALDAALYTAGLPTVSQFSTKNPWAAALIIALNILGVIGLAMHFSNGEHK